jgi:hypothetical protein
MAVQDTWKKRGPFRRVRSAGYEVEKVIPLVFVFSHFHHLEVLAGKKVSV